MNKIEIDYKNGNNYGIPMDTDESIKIFDNGLVQLCIYDNHRFELNIQHLKIILDLHKNLYEDGK